VAASYGAPGVYIEEQPSGSMPIDGVGTAIAALVGFTEKYDPDEGDPTDPGRRQAATRHELPQYERIYGGYARGAMLPHAVRGFFENGGSACYIVRIPGANGGGRLVTRIPGETDDPTTGFIRPVPVTEPPAGPGGIHCRRRGTATAGGCPTPWACGCPSGSTGRCGWAGSRS
jgi:hypothetical protein